MGPFPWKTVEDALTAKPTGDAACETANGEWDDIRWLEAFTEARRSGVYGVSARMRVIVAHHTVRQCIDQPEILALCKEAASRSVCHDDLGSTIVDPLLSSLPQTTEVWKGDCLEAGLLLEDEGFNPVVLNMANQFGPGGGWSCGDGAQEENIFRRTSYFASLIPSTTSFHPDCAVLERDCPYTYPIGDYSTVYSPDVVVLKGAEADGYPTLKKVRKMSFVACAAYRCPDCGEEPLFELPEEVVVGTKKKIRSILATALHHGHDAVVLSAFGCGAFSNPPNQVAKLFSEVLSDAPFSGAFKKVVFAIFNDENAGGWVNPEGNVIPFERVFGKSPRDVPRIE